MYTDTRTQPFARLLVLNSSESSFTPPLVTDAPPIEGVIAFADFELGATPNHLLLVPFGGDAPDQTGEVRIYGYRKLSRMGFVSQWVPCLLCELAVTLGNRPGSAGGVLGGGEYLADTLAVTKGTANVSVEVVSPEEDLPAHALIDIKGFPRVQVRFATGGSAASLNTLWTVL